MHGAGDFLEFGGLDAAVDFFRGGEGLADHADFAPGRVIEIEPLDRHRIPRKPRPDGGEAAEG